MRNGLFLFLYLFADVVELSAEFGAFGLKLFVHTGFLRQPVDAADGRIGGILGILKDALCFIFGP